jgi:hypothetical protein
MKRFIVHPNWHIIITFLERQWRLELKLARNLWNGTLKLIMIIYLWPDAVEVQHAIWGVSCTFFLWHALRFSAAAASYSCEKSRASLRNPETWCYVLILPTSPTSLLISSFIHVADDNREVSRDQRVMLSMHWDGECVRPILWGCLRQKKVQDPQPVVIFYSFNWSFQLFLHAGRTFFIL